ncbi:hypothetical protein APHNP_0217 [Anaplasma phagocytophilum str. ApNP]|uniref:Uncharacterized protein n=1 Tax=Anaplasma phagocytophilum str. ApNP TaxID=1359153 RepID=A0A0F3NLP8_ANAPH|nr:hypothetical protein APHNP_0217 [Anaplasma phagocytophilum str. ApNP]
MSRITLPRVEISYQIEQCFAIMSQKLIHMTSLHTIAHLLDILM